jgi:hypothetical protein
MLFDEKTFDRLLDRVEAEVRKVLDKHGIKPKSAENENPASK